MQRNIIRISFFILFFIPSYAGLYFHFANQNVFKLFQKLKENFNFKITAILSGLSNSNHSQYLKDAVYKNYLERIAPNTVAFYFGQLLINH
jgi:hypothetical protein